VDKKWPTAAAQASRYSATSPIQLLIRNSNRPINIGVSE
jgi:hypothetical protein